LRFQKGKGRPWKTFLKKSFPNLSKNFNLKPLRGFSKAKGKDKTLENFFEKKFYKPFKKL
jgi:hypothetical protein